MTTSRDRLVAAYNAAVERGDAATARFYANRLLTEQITRHIDEVLAHPPGGDVRDHDRT